MADTGKDYGERRKLNILIMPSWYFSYRRDNVTTGIFHYEQAVDFQKYCNVAVYYPFDRTLEEEMVRHEDRGVFTYRSQFHPKERLRNRVRIFRSFRKIRKEFQPDIIFAHVAVEAGKYAAFLSRFYHIPLVLMEHSSTEVSLAGKVGYYISKYVYERCDYIACCSENLKNNLQQFFPKLQFDVVYNGIQPADIVSDKSQNYRVEGVTNIVIVGLFYSIDIKGYQFLLPAMRQILDKGCSAVLHIIGDGEYREHYMQMAKELGIEKECIFYGDCPRDKVYEIVSQMDFFVSSSILECSGVSVQEAMLLGKPVLVTKSGGANSLVTNDTAIVVDKGSTQALADGLEEMIRKYKEFDTAAIKEYAENKFEISHISRQYMQIFYDLACKDSK
ncbi:MAG: glycosyltransferase [Lachnospiraceae bacterium]|nr:glycosyltransferase [Lachnospiraceae bacterium]